MRSISYKHQIFFITAFALLLRLFFLKNIGIWYDDAVSIAFAQHDWGDFFSHRDALKPLFYLLLKFWIFIFGDSRLYMLRALPAVIGAASVVVMYLLVRDLLGKKTALLSSFLMAVSVFNINYSQQVKEYSLTVFFALLALLFLIKIVIKQRPFYWLLFLANLFLCLTHPSGIFIVLLEVAYILSLKKTLEEAVYRKSRNALIFNLAVVALIVFLGYLGKIPSNNLYWVEPAGLRHIIETFEAFAYGGPRQIQGGTGLSIDSKFLLYPRVYSGLLLFILGYALWQLKYLNRESRNMLLLWMALPAAAMYFFSKLFFNIYVVKYTLISAPAFYVLVSLGVVKLKKKLRALVFVLLIAGSAFSLKVYFQNTIPFDWLNLAEYVDSKVENNDAILLSPSEQLLPFWYHFSKDNNDKLRYIDISGAKFGGQWQNYFYKYGYLVEGIERGRAEKYLSSPESKNRLLSAGNIVLILSPFWHGNQASAKKLLKELKNNYRLNSRAYFSHIGVEVFYLEKAM